MVEANGVTSGDRSASAQFDAKLHGDGVTFESADVELLRAVDVAGSLNAAAGELGRSYSRAHKRLAALEEAFGPLVESRRGGDGGGGSVLTDRARGLLSRFERLRTAFSGVADVAETVLPGEVVARDGEVATIETPAGRLRALAPLEASAVTVTIRADTVTLYDPTAAPAPTATSARNRFEGVVRDVSAGESVRRVAVDIGGETPLLALLTAESSRELALAPSSAVVASFKTTATRATPRESGHDDSR